MASFFNTVRRWLGLGNVTIISPVAVDIVNAGIYQTVSVEVINVVNSWST